MKTITFILLLIGVSPVHAQEPEFEWVFANGGVYNDYGNSIVTDVAGNVYSIGRFNGTVDFDPGPEEYNLVAPELSSYVFILKLDSEGNFIWAKSIEGNIYAYGMAMDNLGNLCIIGSFQNFVDFNPGVDEYELGDVGSENFYILKLDSDGDFVWAKAVVGAGAERAFGIAVDNDNDVYVTGRFSGSDVDFDPGPGVHLLNPYSSETLFVMKLESDGNFSWAHSFEGANISQGRAIATDADNHVYITGDYFGTIDFDPSIDVFESTSVESFDVFILKMDVDGNFIWAKSIGAENVDRARDITISMDNNIFIIGNFSYTIDADPGLGIFELTSSGSRDVFILKLDAEGNFVWANSVGGTNFDVGVGLITDSFNDIYLCGSFQDTMDADPGLDVVNLIATDIYDDFIIKLNAAGEHVWAVSFGEDGNDMSEKIVVDNDLNVYTTGSHKEMTDFDPGILEYTEVSNGGNDFYIHKLSQCLPNEGVDTVVSCGPYMWIDGLQYYHNNDTATYTLTNVDGCDSVVTLNLNIINLDVSTSITDLTITANMVDANYQWLDCNEGYVEIFGENEQEFSPEYFGSFAVEVEKGGCIDTSACYEISGVGILENKFQDIKVYPNPSSDFVSFESTGAEMESVKIYNSIGQLIKTWTVSSTFIELNLEEFERGIYTVLIETSSGIARKQIVLK